MKPLYEPWIEFVGKDIQMLGESMQANRAYWVQKSEGQQAHQLQNKVLSLKPPEGLSTSSGMLPNRLPAVTESNDSISSQ